jgi:hypothetical protein
MWARGIVARGKLSGGRFEIIDESLKLQGAQASIAAGGIDMAKKIRRNNSPSREGESNLMPRRAVLDC